MKNIISIVFILITINAFPQDATSKLDLHQSELKAICRKLFVQKITDTDKEKYNHELLIALETALNEPNSFDYAFDSLKNDMAVLTSPDKKFRIFNWNLPKNDGTQEYYGFIQEKYVQVTKTGLFKKSHTETMQLYPLIDKSSEIKNPENTISDNKKWYGMLYNKIILKKTKTKTYYTLLAWDGNDNYSLKKIIDVLTFDNNGTPKFGADIFLMNKKYPKRIIFEYSSTCKMSLRYSTTKDSIVYDHLAPTSPQLEGQFQYYCSDGSYDGFGFKHGKWNYGMYLNATNDKDEKDKFYHDPHDISPSHSQSSTLIEKRKKEKKK